MLADPTLLDRIHTLWDELADYNVAQLDAAREHLLSGLCELAGAQNAAWLGAVRVGAPQPEDPVLGWRPRVIHWLRVTQVLDASSREQARDLEQGQVDETTVRQVALAGRFRVNRLVDLVGPEWFESDYYRGRYLAEGNHDAIWAGIPINEDAEIYIGVFRDGAHPRFSPAERDAVAGLLRGLRWFHRLQMLGHGLLVADAPLTPVERGVLQGLLEGKREKEIAACLGHSPATTHEYVGRIFRKFGINNRAALMALWLGKA